MPVPTVGKTFFETLAQTRFPERFRLTTGTKDVGKDTSERPASGAVWPRPASK